MSGIEAKNLWHRLNNLALVRFLLLVAAGWAIVQLLAYFETVIIIFTFAAILAFLLSYPVQWLRRFLPHSVAVVVVFLISIVILGGLLITVGVALLSQGQQLIDSISAFLTSLLPFLERIERLLSNRNLQIDLSVIQEQLRTQAVSTLVTSLAIVQQFLTNFVTFILIAVVAFFMLLDGEKLWNFILKIVPQKRRIRFTNIMRRSFLGFFSRSVIIVLVPDKFNIYYFLIITSAFCFNTVCNSRNTRYNSWYWSYLRCGNNYFNCLISRCLVSIKSLSRLRSSPANSR